MAKHSKSFKPGNPGGPGRPKGSVGGFNQCRQILDEMFRNNDGNKELLRKDFQRLFEGNPAGFYKKFVEPLMPKDVNINADINNIIRVTLEDD